MINNLRKNQNIPAFQAKFVVEPKARQYIERDMRRIINAANRQISSAKTVAVGKRGIPTPREILKGLTVAVESVTRDIKEGVIKLVKKADDEVHLVFENGMGEIYSHFAFNGNNFMRFPANIHPGDLMPNRDLDCGLPGRFAAKLIRRQVDELISSNQRTLKVIEGGGETIQPKEVRKLKAV